MTNNVLFARKEPLMPLVGVPTRRVREALRQAVALWADLVVLLLVGAIIGGMLMLGTQVVAPYHEKVEIDLSCWSLPKYTILSLGRGFAAYVLSLAFTLIYGTIAAHNRRAASLMIPALDMLQAIPVLGFLPGLVLAMIALFPTRQIGLEIACIVMIFTGQVWNMTFSFHGSLRSIPPSLREVATIQRLSGWQTFRLLEVPAAMIGLVWNSMMSMAGGWFFLTVNEAFVLGNRDYRLPGIGSYMNEAIHQGSTAAVIRAVVAMVLMIVLVDRLFWRPLVVWSQRFKLEETAEAERPQSWVLDVLWRSRLFRVFVGRRSQETMPRIAFLQEPAATNPSGQSGSLGRRVRPVIKPLLKWGTLVPLTIGVGWGTWSLVRLVIGLPLYEPASHADWLTVFLALAASFLRTSAAVLIGTAWTLPVGILIGLSPRWSQRLQPVIQVAASFPAPMLFPLVTMLLVVLHVPFTIGCVALMLLGAQWYILFNVIAGAKAIPDDLKEVANAYGLGGWQCWTQLYLPCVFPYLMTGLVTAAGGAWNATIVSEYVQLQDETYSAFGLGSMINHATARGNFSLLTASVVTMALFVVLLNRFFWKRLHRLAEDRYSLQA
ncbi:MAG: ABC transporter permease subunit [Planctomycetes bacterium]|nr:ABC transporter permease subunit [Planctomycetota bacterium]